MVPDDKRTIRSLWSTYGPAAILEELMEIHQDQVREYTTCSEKDEEGAAETAAENSAIIDVFKAAIGHLPEGY